MKRLLPLIALFNFHSFNVQAQQYYPMLDSVNYWSFVDNYFAVTPFSAQLFVQPPCSYPGFYNHLYTDQDTVINTFTYKKLYTGDFNQCLYGFLREDTALRKVFFQDVVDSPEVVLYDFSMQPGDTIIINFISTWGFYFPSGIYRLDSISNVTIQAGVRRAFHLNCLTTATPYTLTWIESVGNLGDVIYPYFLNDYGGLLQGYGCYGFPHDLYHFMTCFEHNQKVYFDSCAYNIAVNNWCFNVTDTCNYYNICGGVSEWNSAELSIGPNPVADALEIRSTNYLLTISQISIYDLTGKNVFSIHPPADYQKSDFKIDVSSLTSGFYFLLLNSDEKSFRLKFIKK